MTTCTPYYPGDKVRCQGTLKDANGTNFDPSVVYAWYKAPGAAVVTLQYGVDAAVGKSATGIYYLDVPAPTGGDYYYGFYSTGTGQAASVDGIFTVAESVRL